jgi:ABC-type glycerol-3-phosphate transport system substrate-binding protein
VKKLLVGLIIIVFTTGMIFAGTGCKTESSSEATAEETAEATGEESGEAITIEIWDWQAGPAFDGAFEKIKPAYEAAHPNITIDRTGYNLSEWDELIKTGLQSGDLPDLFGLYQGPQLWDVADTGILYEWDDAINADPEWKANLGKTYGIGGTLDRNGKTVAVSYDIFYIGMWGYTNILEEMGKTEEDVRALKTMDELADFAEGLKAEGFDKWYISTGFLGQYMIRELFWTFVYQQTTPEDLTLKAEFMQDGVKWTDEEFLIACKAVQAMARMTREDVLSLDYQTDHYSIMLNQEAWGSLYDGPWATAVLIDSPDAINNVFGFFHPPVVEGAATNVWAADAGQILAMEKDNPNKDAVIEFMKWMHSEEASSYMIEQLIHPAGKFPDDWKSLVDYEIYFELVEMFESSDVSPWICYTAEIEAALIDNLTQVFTGDATPEEAMAAVQQVTDDYWAAQ